jgi:hypothetical protein
MGLHPQGEITRYKLPFIFARLKLLASKSFQVMHWSANSGTQARSCSCPPNSRARVFLFSALHRHESLCYPILALISEFGEGHYAQKLPWTYRARLREQDKIFSSRNVLVWRCGARFERTDYPKQFISPHVEAKCHLGRPPCASWAFLRPLTFP